MATRSTISSKGQITIPLKIRQLLGVKHGDKVEFVVENGSPVLRAVPPEDDPFLKYVGCLPPLENGQGTVAWWREMRGHDEFDEDL
jgi:AbrB family looped-hinge helix DNA binding protein